MEKKNKIWNLRHMLVIYLYLTLCSKTHTSRQTLNNHIDRPTFTRFLETKT